MTAAITGAAIGFLVWAGIFIRLIAIGGNPVADRLAIGCLLLTGTGAAIGWLKSRLLP